MTAANVPTEKKSSTGKIIGFIGCGCLGIGLVIVAIIATLVVALFIRLNEHPCSTL